GLLSSECADETTASGGRQGPPAELLRSTTKLTRIDFQTLADKRLREAGTLFDAAHYDGAIYISGYAVECVLKAF
ncbi:MAG TPA: hypothetical protein VE932_21090, partial [Patescibacteria group bacterium]|nr:hypothetical protein [Patescibacteria group bacterium]